MNLTLKEKRVIFQILVLIMKADLVTKQEEIDFLDNVFQEYGLSIDEFDHMDDIDYDYLKNEFSLLSDATKQYAKNVFMQMAKCDGYVDPREVKMIETFN